MGQIIIPPTGNLDVPLSSRAAAVDWTAARAAFLDRLAIFAAGGAGELTPARAALLANADAAVTGRPAAADYTAARAGKLDNVRIKSIQRGSIVIAAGTLSNTASITSVNTAKAFVTWLGVDADGGNFWSKVPGTLVLTNATTVTATRGGTGEGGVTTTVWYEVIEWE